MDYLAFEQLREKLATKSSDLLRLDCMAPAKALTALCTFQETSERNINGTLDVAVSSWANATGEKIPEDELVAGTGVRDILRALFLFLSQQIQELWLPEDVYPVYWEIARQASFVPQPFRTLPEPDWSFLTRTTRRAIALLPVPLSPLGRYLTEEEIQRLAGWLATDKRRILIVDAAYTYDFEQARSVLRPLVESGRCVVLWSCSKSWLQPDVLGIARCPSLWRQSISEGIARDSPRKLADIIHVLMAEAHLPSRLQRSFDREWRRLGPRIKSAAPHWQPPRTGYFSVIDVPFENLVQKHRILAVPATVFGSKRDLSIITCLHDLVAHERAETDR